MCRLIDADACAQWNAVPADHRLDCDLKSCNRQPVERDFMANMKLNYLHVHFLLRLACVCPMATGGDPDLVRISTEILSLVVEAIMLKDQILNSGTSLVWKVTQISPILQQPTHYYLQISRLPTMAYRPPGSSALPLSIRGSLQRSLISVFRKSSKI